MIPLALVGMSYREAPSAVRAALAAFAFGALDGDPGDVVDLYTVPQLHLAVLAVARVIRHD